MADAPASDDAADIGVTGANGANSANIANGARGATAANCARGAALVPLLTTDWLQALPGPEAHELCVHMGMMARGRIGGLLAGLGFMFAPAHHASMKHVGPTRVELGTRTIFNLLGPLSNPAGVRRQVTGVFSRAWVEPLAQVLSNLGCQSCWICHGEGGFDAVSSIGLTEHIGRGNYPSYFSFLYGKLRPEGRMLNHTITRPNDAWQSHFKKSFILIRRFFFRSLFASKIKIFRSFFFSRLAAFSIWIFRFEDLSILTSNRFKRVFVSGSILFSRGILFSGSILFIRSSILVFFSS